MYIMNAEMEMKDNKSKKLIKKGTIIAIGIAICLALSLALYYLPQSLCIICLSRSRSWPELMMRGR